MKESDHFLDLDMDGKSNIQWILNDNKIIYLLTAIGLSPGGSTHLHTNNTQNNTNNNRTTQISNNVEECGPSLVFANFTLAFALQLRKKHRKTSVRVRKTSVRVQYTYYQNTHTFQNLRVRTHTHTLQNNIKPLQYTCSGRNRIIPLTRRPNTGSTPTQARNVTA